MAAATDEMTALFLWGLGVFAVRWSVCFGSSRFGAYGHGKYGDQACARLYLASHAALLPVKVVSILKCSNPIKL